MQFLSSNDHLNLEQSETHQSTINDNLYGRQNYLNLTKMTMFLMVNVVRRIEINLSTQQQQNLQIKKRGRGAKTTFNLDNTEFSASWEEKRNKFLVQLYNVMQFPLEKLWSPPIAEENFIK